MGRRLAAILAVDMVGFSRLMSTDERETIARQKKHRREIVDPQISRHAGRIVKTTGDGLLAEFPSVVDAVNCAIAFQSSIHELERDFPDDTRILYRAGINLGDIVLEDGDIFGDGVNVAARLEALAPPSGLCISDMVRQNLHGTVGASFEDLGEQNLKNIQRKIRAWRWSPEHENQSTQQVYHTAETVQDPIPTILVQPFETLSPDADQRFFAEGFSDDIATAISKLGTLKVISVPEKGGGNGARYRVKGTFRIAGPRIRCNVQLHDLKDGSQIWSEKCDGLTEEIFDFQDRITEQVVTAVEIELIEGQQARVWRKEAGNAEAYEDFLKGRSAYKEYSHPGNARARSAYEAALEKSPTFLSAAVGLARTHIEDATFGWSADKNRSLEEARRLLEGNFAVDPDHASTHMELAHIHMVEGDFRNARLEAEISIALDPNNADAHNALSYVLTLQGRPEESLSSSRRAIALNPGAPEFYFFSMAEALVASKRYQEALAVCDRILAKRPDWLMARILRALALEGLGNFEEAKKEIRTLLDISPRFTAGRWKRAIMYPDRPDVPDLMARLVSIGLPE